MKIKCVCGADMDLIGSETYFSTFYTYKCANCGKRITDYEHYMQAMQKRKIAACYF